MKAAIYEQFQGTVTVQNVPDPAPKPHGVVVAVRATGLCRSDWHGWMGHDPDIVLPHVPGHELAGTVAAVGKDVRHFAIGDRVTVPFVSGCGACADCHAGHHQVCAHQTQPGFTHWGSFAEYVALDYADTNLVRLPETISDVAAATLGCRFVTAFRAVVDQAKTSGGQYVAIHGCGGVGLSAVMVANALGALPIAVDINQENLAMARALGAYATIDATECADVVGQVKALTDGGAQVSLDALGSQTTCFNSIANLRRRGKHIQVGLMAGSHDHPRVPMGQVIAHELEIIGSHGMQAFRYADMMAMIAKGKLQPQKLVEKTISLSMAAHALAQMDKFEHKGVLVVDNFG